MPSLHRSHRTGGPADRVLHFQGIVAAMPRFIWVLGRAAGQYSREVDNPFQLEADVVILVDHLANQGRAGQLNSSGGGKTRPNQSLEPTRVGRPPLAAQLQRYAARSWVGTYLKLIYGLR